MQRPGGHKKRDPCPGLGAPGQKESSFPGRSTQSPALEKKDFPRSGRSGDLRASLGEEECLVTPSFPGDTQGSSESPLLSGKAPSPRLHSLGLQKLRSHLPPCKRAPSGASLSDPAPWTWHGCPGRNIAQGSFLEINKGCFIQVGSILCSPTLQLIRSRGQGK